MRSSFIANSVMTFFLIGIWLGSVRQYSLPGHVIAILLVAGLVCWLFRDKKKPFLILCSTTALATGGTYTQTWRNRYWTSFPEKMTFTGKVVDSPDIRLTKTFLVVQPENQKGKLLVKADRFPRYEYGDQLNISGAVELPEAFNGFNYPLFLERFGVYGIMNQPKIKLSKPAQRFNLYSVLYALRGKIERPMQKVLPEPESSFLGGILLGSKRAIPQDIQDALKATGTSHVIAISGANITIMLGILLQFLPLYSRRQQFWATVLIGVFISVLTGGSASVMRGAFVASLGAYLRMRGRRAWVTPFILFSLTIMLLNNPLLLVADPGFQLSFAAYAGLLYLGTPLSKYLENVNLPEVVKSSFTETTAATLGTAPLSFWIFGQLSLLGLLVNPLILWLLPAITFLGLAFCLLAWIPLLSKLIAIPLWLMLHAVLQTIQWFSRFSFATIHWKL